MVRAEVAYTALDVYNAVSGAADDGSSAVIEGGTLQLLYSSALAGIPYELPPDASVPATPPMLEVAGDGAMFEVAIADQLAYRVWTCAWIDALGEGSVPEPVAFDALALPGTFPHAYAIPEQEQSQLDDAVALGVEGIEDFARVMCPG